jgi:hypothetical protein
VKEGKVNSKVLDNVLTDPDFEANFEKFKEWERRDNEEKNNKEEEKKEGETPKVEEEKMDI